MTLLSPHPQVHATVYGSTATLITPHGDEELIDAAAGQDVRGWVLTRTATIASELHQSVELQTTGDRGEHRLLVNPDGTITRPEHPATRRESRTTEPGNHDIPELPQSQPAGGMGDETSQAPDATAAEPDRRPSFISGPERAPQAQMGWRGALARAGFTVKPSARDVARDAAVRAVSQHWAGCRTIAVVNGKGGVGKTMTTAMLAAAFARYGGGSVLAWDNNDTRGTLGWRTETGPHDATVQDLLPETSRLLEPAAGIAEIAGFVHHQTADRYDVLRSNPELLAVRQRIQADEFDRLMAVAARYYRLVIFDSGNDESADRWLRMIDSSYQLVIPTLASPESAESAALLLEALAARDERSAALATHAVVIVTQHDRHTAADANSIIDGFTGRVRAVHHIPFDPALKSGPLRFDTLRPATRDAWIAAAAATTTHL
ncbi:MULTISPECIES: MinD/ParA family ATP-binding protein [Microbacterium]|uniref:ATPase n=1 Tax=Microbacterium wangchenii TaxID=2541726 RepID=A0ABX5SRH5_9MICO|nr:MULTISPECIES: AAA family ATPase [Microbacterium]MCK6066532.1 AAA family ATPase [Microbacterium sp. EYE_512]QBR87484.1 ATPase [Microbacterium wangchenii]TXK14806.1 AAA family ATPase [Microbacterium wangchenii]